MSLIQVVAGMVEEMGGASCDDVLPLLPGQTRAKVMTAFKNARRAGLIHCLGHQRFHGIGSGTVAAKHYPGARPPLAMKKLPEGAPPPASVWELGEVPARSWPPVGEGRRFNLLGSWTD